MSKSTRPQNFAKLRKQKAKTRAQEAANTEREQQEASARLGHWPAAGGKLPILKPLPSKSGQAQPLPDPPESADGYLFQLRLTLRAPFLFKSNASLKLGLDTATVSDTQGRPLIPGTQIKGHLLRAMAELGCTDAQLDQWMGGRSNDPFDEPRPGLLLFDDHWQGDALPVQADAQLPVRPRIQIDPTTGTAQRGSIQMIEQTHPPGMDVVFVGAIRAPLMNRAAARLLQQLLQRALNWIPAMGALKGIGFGRIVAARVQAEPLQVQPIAAVASTRVQLEFQLDRPYCFGSRVLENNRFESTVHVPGAAIRACLFRLADRLIRERAHLSHCPELLAHADLLCAHDNHIHVGHAWPGTTTAVRTPHVIPQCILAAGDTFIDGSAPQWREPSLVDGLSPAFPVDWKGQADRYLKTMGCSGPKGEIRVRTAIAGETGAAADEQLFTMDCLIPSIGTAPAVFRTWIDCSEADPAVAPALQAAVAALLPLALGRLGKTEARACELRLTDLPQAQCPELHDGQDVVLYLQSDLLAGPSEGTDMLSVYQRFFHDRSHGSMVLVDFWARQHWVGGTYLKKRFRQHAYRARLLTDAGSVFRLTVTDAQAAAVQLQRWLTTGIPGVEDEDWRFNPWIRANGYGEVSLWNGLPAVQGLSVQTVEQLARAEHGA